MIEQKRHLFANGLVGALTGFSIGTFLDYRHLELILTNPETLKFSAYQAEAIFFLGLFGLGFGVPISYLQKHIKPYYIIVIGCLGSTVALLLLWTATVTNQWYSNKAALLALFNFFAGYTVAHIYYTSLWVGFSASANNLNFVTLFHHLPLVTSAVLSWLIFGASHSNLFTIQFCATVLASLAAIVLLKTSPTVEEPVRVIGEARRFTLPAYEYPASDTESIAESEASSTEAAVRAPLLPSASRWERVTGDLRDALPHIVIFAFGAAVNMPFSYSTASDPSWHLILSAGASILASFIGAWRAVPRATFLTIIIGLRAVFLITAIAQNEVPNVEDFLYATGGIVQGAFWTIIPQMLFELHGYKRITLLWSSAIFGFAIISCVHNFGILAFLNDRSSLAICSLKTCPVLISEFQLASNLCILIATFWLRTKTL